MQTLKAVGATLVEIHGQHDERALVDTATHRRLLDAFAGLEKDVAAVEALWDGAAHGASRARRASRRHGARRARGRLSAPRRPRNWRKLAPQEGEETSLAERRTVMMQGEKIAERSARRAGGRRRHAIAGGGAGGCGAPAGAPRRHSAPALIEPAVKAIDAALNALEEADSISMRRLIAADFDPAELERIEERLFALARRGAKIFDAGRWAGGAGAKHMRPISR